MILTIAAFILILSVLVLIHELGHFLVAKKLGIKVEEFGFGFPPRIFGRRVGETIYSFNLLPFGGFVKLYGEDEAGRGGLKIRNSKFEIRSADLHRAFFARPPSQKALVVIAGVVMNILLAIVIYYIFLYISNFKTELPLFAERKFFFVNQENRNLDKHDLIVSTISQNSPARYAGIRPPVKILSINSKTVEDRLAFIELVNKNKGRQVSLEWQDVKTGRVFSATVTPRVSPPKNEGPLGVGFFPIAFLSYDTPAQRLASGITYPANIFLYTFDILGKLISVSIKEKTTEPVSEGVAGPVGIYSLVGNIMQIPNVKERVLQVLNLAGNLSMSLAFFNILPIPALDGGRLFFIGIEMITRKKVHPRFEALAHAIGMALLLLLLLLITARDISRILSGKSIFQP